MAKNKSGISKLRGVASIFWNFRGGRLRALWRVLITLLVTILLMFLFGMPFFALGGGSPDLYIEKIVLYLAVIVAIMFTTRIIDKRRFSETGIYLKRSWWVDLGFGLLLGVVLMTIIFIVELAAGWISIKEILYNGNSDQPLLVGLLPPLLLMLIVGVAEELFFRGYLLLNLAEGFNLHMISPRWAVIIAWLLTSALFGFAHIINPNATVISSVYITLAGIWLGLGYILTGSLAIPIGIHITWNFFQGYVFGFPVSGGRDFTTTAIVIEQGGPQLWTGGAFGPEAGLIGLATILLGVLVVIAWVRYRYGGITLYTAIAEPPSKQ
jgi:membrane protease YdiL (CAAX protease family)